MSKYLLDVNVVIAVRDPSQINHDATHLWFAKARGRIHRVACPIPENSVASKFSNPGCPSIDWLPNELMDHLDGFVTQNLGHIFWDDAVSLQDKPLFDCSMIPANNQLTNSCLPGVAITHNNRLVTLNRSIPWQDAGQKSESNPSLLK